MFSWFRRRPAPVLPAPSSLDAPPAWVEALTEALQKQTRAVTKQNAKLEAMVGEVDARLVSLGAALKLSAPQHSSELNCEAVFDALDGLDAARALSRDVHLSEGLLRVSERLERFIVQNGYQRTTGVGKLPDARVMRVVGTEPCADIVPGRVSRVVRAAVLRGSDVVREGSVIVSSAEGEDGQRMGN